MKPLVGTQRETFLINQGRFYAGMRYYSSADEAFTALENFLPLKEFNFTFRPDFVHFRQGFIEVQELNQLVDLTKRKAQIDNSFILKELEDRGLTFLQERLESEYE